MIIGLAGLKGSGKSAVADAIVARLSAEKSYKLPFAAGLKLMLRTLLVNANVNDVDQYIYGDKKEEPLYVLGGQTARYAMQTLGTEWGRELISENLWTNITMARAMSLESVGATVVIDDVRFPGELQAIKQAKGVVFNIVRPGVEPGSDEHQSEFGVYAPHVGNGKTPDVAACIILKELGYAIL